MTRRCRLPALLILHLVVTGLALAQDSPPPPAGPVALRDEHVLAQPRLTLPPIAPDTVAPGEWSYRLGFLWCSSFAWAQDVPGEIPRDRRFLIDAETRTLDFTLTRGLSANTHVSLRVPVRWRGGGQLDGLIDAWHRLFGLPDGDRPAFRRNAFRVEGLTPGFQPFSWNDDSGTGLGNVELEGRWRFHPGRDGGWRAALAARVALPTGSVPFDDDGAGVGLQVVAARRLARPLDLFVGVGGLVQGRGPVRGVQYAGSRAHAFLALEWRLLRFFRVVGETDVASRLVRGIDLYPGMHWIANLSGRVPVGERASFELGITENFKNQSSTTDFGLHFGLVLRPAAAPPRSQP